MANRRSLTRSDRVSELSTGGIAVDAVLSRSGVLEYTTPNGVVREFRTPSVVTDPSSVESLRGATVTVEHPQERKVTTDNYRDTVVGHVHEVRVDGDKVVGVLHIHDAETVRQVLDGKLVELSPGYTVDLDDTPGTDAKYGSYDAITTAMAYNHISLLAPGEGRQGSGVSLRLDAAGEPVLEYNDAHEPTPTDKVDTVDEEQIKALFEAHKAEVAEMVASMLEAKADEIPEEPKADEMPEEKVDEETLALEDRTDRKCLDAALAYERVTGEPADLTKTAREVLLAAVEAAGVKGLRADASDERLLGALDAHRAAPAPSAWAQTKTDAVDAPVFKSADDYNRERIAKMAGK
jgi:hypothetical protein